MENTKLNLWEKIAKISGEIGYLQKDDCVGFGKNSYRAMSSEKVISVCSEKMSAYKIVVYPVSQNYTRTDERIVDRDGKEKINRISDVDVTYEVVNAENPVEKFQVVSSGTGVDTQDKGIGKAQTYAYKTMLLRLFNIPTGEDSDKIHSDDYTEKLYGSKSNFKLTEKQIKRLYTLADIAKMDSVKLINLNNQKYNTSFKSVEELDKESYERICDYLQKTIDSTKK